jgi:PAS domain S-box-containing protein
MPPPPQGQREDIFSPEKSPSGYPPFRPLAGLSAGIRVRLLALVLLALLPTLGLTLLLARDHRNQITQDVNDHALRLSRFTAATLERDIQAARIFLTALSHDYRNASDSSLCPEFLASLDIKPELYDAVGVADSTGRIRCQVPPNQGPGRLDSSLWFQGARSSRRFSVGYDLDRTLIDKVTMEFAFPVTGSNGRVQAVYFSALDLEWLNRLAERLELPPGSALTVSDRSGRTLVRYPHPEMWVGKNFPDAPLSRSVSVQDEGVVKSPGIDGIVRLYAFSHLDNGELSVRLGIPLEAAYAAARAAMLRNLVGLGVVTVMALAAAWLAGHMLVVRHVNQLVAATRSLAAGNLDTRTGMDHAAGELGQLARAFDEMAESLEWRDAQLRESERERSQSEGRFSEIVERAPDAILGVDGDFSLFFCNQGAEEMFGWPREELEGMELGHLEGAGRNAATLVRALRDQRQERVEAFLVRRDGTPFRADVSVSRAERNGRVTYTLIVRERGG